MQMPLVRVGASRRTGCVHLLDGAAPGPRQQAALTSGGATPASVPAVLPGCGGTFQVPTPGGSGTSEGTLCWGGGPGAASCWLVPRPRPAPRTCPAAEAAPLQGGKPGLCTRGARARPPAGAALPLLDRPPGKFQAWPAARGAGRLRLSAGSCHERLSLGRPGPEVALNPCGASAAPRALPPLSTSLCPQLCGPGRAAGTSSVGPAGALPCARGTEVLMNCGLSQDPPSSSSDLRWGRVGNAGCPPSPGRAALSPTCGPRFSPRELPPPPGGGCLQVQRHQRPLPHEGPGSHGDRAAPGCDTAMGRGSGGLGSLLNADPDSVSLERPWQSPVPSQMSLS